MRFGWKPEEAHWSSPDHSMGFALLSPSYDQNTSFERSIIYWWDKLQNLIHYIVTILNT
jgi:hypothetical protein